MPVHRPSVAVLLALSLLAGACGRPAQVSRVAAAANLTVALTQIERAFERDTGARLDIVYGASGTLTRQIEDGAPFELFLAADEEYPRRVYEAGLSRDEGVVYAVGRLALFAPHGSPLTVDASFAGLKRLLTDDARARFAIANPDVAPYGRAAEAALKAHGVWDAVRPRLVLGDTVAQAAQFATSGNVAGGLIAYALVLTPDFANRGSHVVVAETDHPPLRQAMVLLKAARAPAVHFYEYLQTAAAQQVFRRHGYGVPQ